MAAQRSSVQVLAVNAGSSSLKLGVYEVWAAAHEPVAAPLLACIEGLESGGQPRLCRPGLADQSLHLEPDSSFMDALGALLPWLEEVLERTSLSAVAHRVVHGGGLYQGAVQVDKSVLAKLRRFESLAPLHQPHNLNALQAFASQWPDLPQIACFDTAFHADMPALEAQFALPELPELRGVRRYGFHGLSYDYVSRCLMKQSKRAQGEQARVLMAHLGNGASLCATLGGRSLATSMGFSALDGLMMGTRSGSLDAGVLLHLLRQGYSADRLEKLLYLQSGLKGVSGVSADMRSLRASPDPRAAAAIALFGYRLLRESGALLALLGGLDVLAFTGGIGEHDARLRAELCQSLAFTGLQLDAQANAAAVGSQVRAVHAAQSAVEVWVVPTDEGRMAAEQAAELLARNSAV